MSSITNLFGLILLQSCVANFQCYDRESGLLTTTNEDVWTHCGQSMTDGNTYSSLTLVSCGVRTRDASEEDVAGAYSLQNTAQNDRRQCYAYNGANSAGVYSRARCCDFTHLGDVTSLGQVTSAIYGDDVTLVSTCGESTSTHVHLTGCHSFSYAFTNNGAYPGGSISYNPARTAKVTGIDYSWDGHTCTVAAGDAGGSATYGNYVCVDSPSFALQCKLRYSAISQATASEPSTASVSCGSGYAMVGCSGYGFNSTLNSWWIDNNVCYARSRNNIGVYAIATCCRLETTAPTDDPTASPTQRPSAHPSVSPTETSASPSQQTNAPSTGAPSASPTTPMPTDVPSAAPTVASRDPTSAPITSTSPTLSPSEYPTRATRDPTVSPTMPTQRPHEWEPCIEEFVLSTSSDTSDANQGLISIDVSTAAQKLRLRLSGPSNKWFGIGFGSNLMSNTYAITVSEQATLEIAQRILGDQASGTRVSDVLDTEYEIDGGVTRNVSIVLDWNHIYDFTDFVECKLETLPIIWAHGAEAAFGYHGVYKTNALQLRSCACVDEETTAAPNTQPTAAPSPDVLEGDSAVSVHVRVLLPWTLLFAFVLCFIAGV